MTAGWLLLHQAPGEPPWPPWELRALWEGLGPTGAVTVAAHPWGWDCPQLQEPVWPLAELCHGSCCQRMLGVGRGAAHPKEPLGSWVGSPGPEMFCWSWQGLSGPFLWLSHRGPSHVAVQRALPSPHQAEAGARAPHAWDKAGAALTGWPCQALIRDSLSRQAGGSVWGLLGKRT